MLDQTGGVTYSKLDADENKVEAHVGQARLFNFSCFNPHATDGAYVQFFDALAADVDLGTTPPLFVVPLPAGTAVNLALTLARRFGVAVTFAVTAGPANSSAPPADCVVQFDYQ